MLLHAPAVALPPACPLSTSACYYFPHPSLPLPPTAPPDSNSECPPLAPKFIPPPPPEAGRRVLNVLRRLKEYDLLENPPHSPSTVLRGGREEAHVALPHVLRHDELAR